AVRRGPWMKGLERTNVLTGYFALGVLVLILSPVLDPQRISVSNQVARLNSGKVAADKFDYQFLRFRAGRPGLDALKQLSASHSGQIATKAKQALDMKEWFQHETFDAAGITIVPAGRPFPPELSNPRALGGLRCQSSDRCVAAFTDLDGDGVDEIVLVSPLMGVIYAQRDGVWRQVGAIGRVCPAEVEAMARGQFSLKPSPYKDLDVGGVRLSTEIRDERVCPNQASGERLDTQLVKPPPPPNPSASAPPASQAPRAPAPPAGR
ncbi:MAG TPA: hypothetical protein VFN88_06800, partial [Caulobacteraceae bacterium]|nr:hypothetical protein [Caulobacteraceae bacterium]